jgi:hypothetical protein
MEKEESWVNLKLKCWEGGWGDVDHGSMAWPTNYSSATTRWWNGGCRIKWDEGKGTCVEHAREDPIDLTGDEDWFDGESSLSMEGRKD